MKANPFGLRQQGISQADLRMARPLFPNQSDAVGPKACEILGLNSLNVGSSVAHFCYSVAQAICPKEVIFVGQDLAYGEGGRTHSSGFAEGSASDGLAD